MRRSRDEGHGATRRSRVSPLRGRRPVTPPTDEERINALAADAHVPVAEILKDVADFRLALETDMIIAAAALDADSPELLSEMLDGERAELADFHGKVLDRLADAAASDELALRRARRPRAGRVSRIVASAAAVVAVAGIGRAAVTSAPTAPAVRPVGNSAALATAQDRYADFSSAVAGESPGAVQDAAEQLHESLQDLITQHAADPEVAQRTAQLLQAEISLLQANDPDGASLVLAQAQNLVRLLRGSAPPQVRASVAPLLDAVTPRETKKPPAKPTASPASPKPTATPTATASQEPQDTDKNDDTPIDTP